MWFAQGQKGKVTEQGPSSGSVWLQNPGFSSRSVHLERGKDSTQNSKEGGTKSEGDALGDEACPLSTTGPARVKIIHSRKAEENALSIDTTTPGAQTLPGLTNRLPSLPCARSSRRRFTGGSPGPRRRGLGELAAELGPGPSSTHGESSGVRSGEGEGEQPEKSGKV